jgi:hypothetical protein
MLKKFAKTLATNKIESILGTMLGASAGVLMMVTLLLYGQKSLEKEGEEAE